MKWAETPEGKAAIEKQRQAAVEAAALASIDQEIADAAAHEELLKQQRLCQHLCPHCGIPLKPEEMP